MTYFKKKTIFGNRYALKKLIEFRSLTENYFKLVGPSSYIPHIIEHGELKNLRTKINTCIHIINQVITEANINKTTMAYDPYFTEGNTGEVDILDYIFNSRTERIGSQEVIDLIDRTIGVYSADTISAIIRTINPIFWFIRCLDFIIDIPFSLLQRSGVDAKKYEDNFFVKIIKFIVYFIGSLASILTVLHFLDYL